MLLWSRSQHDTEEASHPASNLTARLRLRLYRCAAQQRLSWLRSQHATRKASTTRICLCVCAGRCVSLCCTNRLLWSRSQHATGELFLALKRNEQEPDPAAAAVVGLTPEAAAAAAAAAAASNAGAGPAAAGSTAGASAATQVSLGCVALMCSTSVVGCAWACAWCLRGSVCAHGVRMCCLCLCEGCRSLSSRASESGMWRRSVVMPW